MSVYRCAAGHRTERLTECTGWRHKLLGFHALPDGRGWEACTCGRAADDSILCPASTGTSAPDALTIPPMCGEVARLVVCTACGRPAAQDYCDDCWSDLQGGCSDG